MLDAPNLRFSWQEVFEMPAPPCRVFAQTIAARRRPIEDRFDSAAHPARRLRCLDPDRLKRLHHERHVDSLHRHCAKDGIYISRKRVGPLCGMLRVAPARLVRSDVALGAAPKSHGTLSALTLGLEGG